MRDHVGTELDYDFIRTYTNRTAHCGDGAIDANTSSNACDNGPVNSRSCLDVLESDLAIKFKSHALWCVAGECLLTTSHDLKPTAARIGCP